MAMLRNHNETPLASWVRGAGAVLPTNPKTIAATHDATHNKDHLHVLRRTYAAVRDLQVLNV
jgi:hypothetical protein